MKLLDRIFRRPIWHSQKETGVSEWAAPIRTIGLACRGCGKHAQLELSNELSDRVEYLCYEDLGPFLEIFTDHRVREWTLVIL